MIKKITVQQLRPGMIIHDLDCKYSGNDFFRSKPTTIEMIVKIKKLGVKELFIDTSKGLDISDTPQGISKDSPKIETKSEPDINISDRKIIAPRPFSEEIIKAKKIKKDVVKIVSNLMGDVRTGKQINISQVGDMVDDMVESVYRNKDAMMCLGLLKDVSEYTFLHSVNVCILMVTFCKAINLDKNTAQKVGVGALLHDIGKMKVPQEVLNKPGKLTDEEFSVMKTHVDHTSNILSELPSVSDISKSVAAEHHERIDGSGYAKGLKGDAITKYGQMAAIVDVFDAITSNRCYHKGMTAYEALQKMLEWGGAHFNKKLVENYIDCVGIYPIRTLVRLESGLLGVVVKPGITNPLQPTVNVFYNTIRRTTIIPKFIDLEREAEKGSPNNILCYEPQEQWDIDVSSYMPNY